MRAILKQRGATVEPVFGWVKEGMGFRRWTVRGLDKVKTQWLLLCTAMNLLRLHKQWAARSCWRRIDRREIGQLPEYE